MTQEPIRAELMGGNISSARGNARFTFAGAGKRRTAPPMRFQREALAPDPNERASAPPPREASRTYRREMVMGLLTSEISLPKAVSFETRRLWRELQDLAVEAVKLGELEISGIHVAWRIGVGSDVPSQIIRKLQDVLSRLNDVHAADWAQWAARYPKKAD
jgi:hypothetical protein